MCFISALFALLKHRRASFASQWCYDIKPVYEYMYILHFFSPSPTPRGNPKPEQQFSLFLSFSSTLYPFTPSHSTLSHLICISRPPSIHSSIYLSKREGLKRAINRTERNTLVLRFHVWGLKEGRGKGKLTLSLGGISCSKYSPMTGTFCEAVSILCSCTSRLFFLFFEKCCALLCDYLSVFGTCACFLSIGCFVSFVPRFF